MHAESVLVVEAMFWGLALGTIVFPRRWSLFAYLLLSQIDGSGAWFASSSALGFENLLKIVVIPTILFFRIPDYESYTRPAWNWALRWWGLLFGFASLAILWSPAPLAGMKMAGYLYSYPLLFAVFFAAWKDRALTIGLIEANLWCAFAMGMLQTLVLGNPYGTQEQTDVRFTTFASPQALALYFLAVIAIVMDSRRNKLRTLASAGLAMMGILLTGSRYILVCLAIFLSLRAILTTGRGAFWRLTKRIAQVTAVVGILLFAVTEYLPENRLNELFQGSLLDADNLDTITTLMWRFGIYRQAWDNIADWSKPRFLIGAGTSSSGDVKATFDVEFANEDLDANRSMHNEVLRAFYEWGAVGLIALVSFVVCLTQQLLKLPSPWRITALCFLPAIVSSLVIENILSNPGAPGGTAIALILGYVLAARPPRSGAAEYVPSRIHRSCIPHTAHG
jgi:hypothetical protein